MIKVQFLFLGASFVCIGLRGLLIAIFTIDTAKIMTMIMIQGCESSDFYLISDFFALHKTPFSDLSCIESISFQAFQTFLSQTLSHL